MAVLNVRAPAPCDWPKALLVLLLVLVGMMGPAKADDSFSVIRLDSGVVRGVSNALYRAYWGIPFARPPLGALRWKAPQPEARWRGERDATRASPACPQAGGATPAELTSEDCLYLNVHTPPDTSAASTLPVMVWIHGGSFASGSGAEYGGATLAREARVVVVTINYRLGALGWLALPSLRAENPAMNYGIQDQQAALRWVQRNIAAFGGDKNRVTLFGQSGGGESVCLNLVSPRAKGLFHRAIVQSAGCASPLGIALSMAKADSVGQSFAKATGCAEGPTQMACLRAKSVQQLQVATPSWSPVMDGPVLPGDFFSLLKEGQYAHVPVMIGATHDEGRLVTALAFEGRTGQPPTEAEYKEALTMLAGPASAEAVATLYPSASYGSPAKALGAVITDLLLACPTDKVAKALANQGPVYAYQFDDAFAPHALAFPARDLGAYHTAELPYLFDLPTSRQLDAGQRDLAQRMRRYWGNFAATGDPNVGPALAVNPNPWPRFDGWLTTYKDLKPGHPAALLNPWSFYAQHKCLIWSPVSSQVSTRGHPGLCPPPQTEFS